MPKQKIHRSQFCNSLRHLYIHTHIQQVLRHIYCSMLLPLTSPYIWPSVTFQLMFIEPEVTVGRHFCHGVDHIMLIFLSKYTVYTLHICHIIRSWFSENSFIMHHPLCLLQHKIIERMVCHDPVERPDAKDLIPELENISKNQRSTHTA